jgi:hypothetical protein
MTSRLDLAADAGVREAIEIAVEAGVPAELIDADLAEAVAGPQDELTGVLLEGRLLWRARQQRGRAPRLLDFRSDA